MARNPFSFLDSESQESVLLLLLQAIIRRSDGEISLSLEELTAVNDGDSLMRYPNDKGDRLVLRFARRGAAAYYRKGDEPSTPVASRSTARTQTPLPQPGEDQPSPAPRHAIHDDIDLALREEEMAQRAQTMAKDRLRQARAEAGAMPWRTRQ